MKKIIQEPFCENLSSDLLSMEPTSNKNEVVISGDNFKKIILETVEGVISSELKESYKEVVTNIIKYNELRRKYLIVSNNVQVYVKDMVHFSNLKDGMKERIDSDILVLKGAIDTMNLNFWSNSHTEEEINDYCEQIESLLNRVKSYKYSSAMYITINNHLKTYNSLYEKEALDAIDFRNVIVSMMNYFRTKQTEFKEFASVSSSLDVPNDFIKNNNLDITLDCIDIIKMIIFKYIEILKGTFLKIEVLIERIINNYNNGSLVELTSDLDLDKVSVVINYLETGIFKIAGEELGIESLESILNLLEAIKAYMKDCLSEDDEIVMAEFFDDISSVSINFMNKLNVIAIGNNSFKKNCLKRTKKDVII